MDAAVKRITVPALCYQRLTQIAGAPMGALRAKSPAYLSAGSGALSTRTAPGDPAARIGAIAFIHRFGSSLNVHVHFHCCVVEGVFQPTAMIGDTAALAKTDDNKPCVGFHAATDLNTAAIVRVQTQVRRRILRTFVRRGLIGKTDRDEMLGWEHSGGFSLDATVCISGTDRAGLERLLRYCAPDTLLTKLAACGRGRTAVAPAPVGFAAPCRNCARPPFALEHLLYHNPKSRSDSPRDLVLTPLELIDKIAALILRTACASSSLLRCAGT